MSTPKLEGFGVRTHEVFNQPQPLADYNPYRADRALVEGVAREGAAFADARIARHAEQAASAELVRAGFQANESAPKLVTHDRFGRRIDEVEFHPAWHELMRWAIASEVHSLPWLRPEPGSWVARAALMLLSAQTEAGHCCPISMTTACVPSLRSTPALAEHWIPRVTAKSYEPRLTTEEAKRSALIGMAMTEKQGGSDVRANTTTATPTRLGAVGEPYVVRGHKWFCSAPMCDAFLILAQAPRGLSCLLLPRVLPDGGRNRFLLQRLKDKLGNRSNASCEVEFDAALAWLVGEEGRGVPTIIEMVNHTRLDCATISAALMRRAVAEAVNHARGRSAFQRRLVDQPLMQNVLAQLCVESEAATALVLRVARGYDERASSERERALSRLLTAVAKYWLSKRAPSHVFEAMECLGGAGYVEESILPRLYREAPLNSIWEGSGNVICLDVLRALKSSPECADALLDELAPARSSDRRFGRALDALEAELANPEPDPRAARRLSERIALCAQAALLIRHAPNAVADAFCAVLTGEVGLAFGTLPQTTACAAIIERALDSALGSHSAQAGPAEGALA